MHLGIVTSSVSRKAGGLYDAVRFLAAFLNQSRGIKVSVFGLQDDFTEPDRAGWGDCIVNDFATVGPAAVGYASGLFPALCSADLDLIHQHGLWTHVSRDVSRWHQRTGRPTVISPHGMLDEWAAQHSGWKKRLASLAWEDRNLKQATALHALCEAEAASIKAYGLKNPVTVIPNGVLQPEIVSRDRVGPGKTLLFLGRLHEKKGLDRLIAAWNTVDPAGWQLKIVGAGDDNYIESLRKLATSSSIEFAGAAYDMQRDAAYLSADAFILPSLSEGFPMAVLEAFSFELPVIMTPECNFPEAFAAGAAVETQYDIATLSASIEWLTGQSDQQLQAMGRQGARLASEQYDWALITARFENLYASIT